MVPDIVNVMHCVPGIELVCLQALMDLRATSAGPLAIAEYVSPKNNAAALLRW